MFDKKALDEYIKTLPALKPVIKEIPGGKQNDKPASGGNNWAMDDLEALTKQVEITSSNNSKKDNNSSKNSEGGSAFGSNAEKWKNDLAALAKAAEVEGV